MKAMLKILVKFRDALTKLSKMKPAILFNAILLFVIILSCQQKVKQAEIRINPHDGIYIPDQIFLDIKSAWIISGNRLDIYNSISKATETLYLEQSEKFIKARGETYLVENNVIFIPGELGAQIRMLKISDDPNMGVEKLQNILDTAYHKKAQ